MTIIREFQDYDGIFSFDTKLDDQSTYEASHIAALEKGEKTHFWFELRREKILKTFRTFVSKEETILEIGGGTGFIAEKLLAEGYFLELADIHSSALHLAKKRGIQSLYQFDLYCPPFKERYDVICLFDVLEHCHDDIKALHALKKMLKPGGKLIFTVPAHQWLWSYDDVLAGHTKRYTKKTLAKIFKEAGLHPYYSRYFFIFILPFLYLRTWIRKKGQKTKELNFSLPLWLNRFFRKLTEMEFLLDPFIPNFAGGSLLAIAKK
jgi:SAM-dependent methyltransferase